jgi:predicted nucleic acid-binding protein
VTVVIDASITLAWYFEDEATAATEAVFDRVTEHGAFAPPLWRLEVANSFQSGIRKKRIDRAFRDKSIADLSILNIVIRNELNDLAWTSTLRLADLYGLTLYDACYLDLAFALGLPLATLDKELRAAATASGIELLGL